MVGGVASIAHCVNTTLIVLIGLRLLWIAIVVFVFVVLVERKSIVVNKLAIFVTKLTFLVFEYPSVSNLMTFAKLNYLVYIEKVRSENYLPLDSSFYTPEILAELTKFYF